ncbi:cinnamyl-alcohol dehydrogenase [Sarracenia purpurea var. burkii]
MANAAEEVQAYGWAARDTSGVLSPFKFPRRRATDEIGEGNIKATTEAVEDSDHSFSPLHQDEKSTNMTFGKAVVGIRHSSWWIGVIASALDASERWYFDGVCFHCSVHFQWFCSGVLRQLLPRAAGMLGVLHKSVLVCLELTCWYAGMDLLGGWSGFAGMLGVHLLQVAGVLVWLCWYAGVVLLKPVLVWLCSSMCWATGDNDVRFKRQLYIRRPYPPRGLYYTKAGNTQGWEHHRAFVNLP